ncbi:hypothetical protein HHK36_008633 [Tetracentron sinense]|uniref:Small auxin up regulated protein n=1 Tax=Tetracentron sinense TaxID=13715 RepID=A0A834ZIV5_TETSI|nr:hypothetical protein HHK36_008633 [Tetracentron sinense]
MGIRLPGMVLHAKQIIRRRRRSLIPTRYHLLEVPKGHFAVYVGESQKKRFVVPLSYLKHPLFQDLLSRAEEEFGFHHPMGGLTIPCNEDDFIHLTSHLNRLIVMGIRLPLMVLHAKHILKLQSIPKNHISLAPTSTDVSKGHFAVYVGEKQKRFEVPISYLNHPSFQDLLSCAEEEFGFDYPKGGLTIPCKEATFIDLTSRLNASKTMGIHLPGIVHAKQILRRSLLNANQSASMAADVPKGHFTVYVGETQKKRFVVPISYLNQPSFQDLLSCAEDEFGFDHPMGGLTIPCKEDAFINLTSRLNSS